MPFRALVVNPCVTDFKLYDEWMHPLGLYALISLLVRNGIEVTYINSLNRGLHTRNKRYGTGDFPSVIIDTPVDYSGIPRRYKRYGDVHPILPPADSRYHPDVIFVGSGMTYWIEGLEYTVHALREFLPDTPIVVGGSTARLMPEEVGRRLPGVSVFAKPLDQADGESCIRIPCCPPLKIEDGILALTDALPFLGRLRHGPVVSSFGCPMRCTYCASGLLTPDFQRRSHERIIAELRMMQTTLGIRNFAWYDDALLYEAEKHFLPLTQTIMEYGIDARFHLPNGFHARWVTPSVAASMKSTGFTTLRLGYESGVSTNASHTSGKSNPDDVARAISILRHAGFKRTEIGIYVMGGIPGQTPDEMIGELIFVGRLGVMPKPVFLSPVPGTPLFEHYAQVFPQIRSNPLLHNDTSFVTCLPGWNYEAVERIMGLARTVSRGESL